MSKNTTRTHVVTVGEVWNTRQGVIRKATVRVAKGQRGAGQFQGATNLRGTVLGAAIPTATVVGQPSLVRVA